jgi:hypothetical protein
MFDKSSIQLSNRSYVVAGMLVVALLVAFPLAAAAGHDAGPSYSGDDAYDQAAGGFAGRSMSIAASYSGDDAYDPATGGLAAWSVGAVASYSGDDAYDPAAGGLPALPVFAFAASQGDDGTCELAVFSSAGGFSGDDPYDPAAGGNPEAIC